MLVDTVIAGRSSYVVLQVRRFLCSNTGCDRRTFVEQIDGLTKAYARTTPMRREILEKIALASAGRAGSRLASTLGVSVGRSTLLRLVRALPDPPTTTVEVLGIDDFALRRRHRYGTILIDMYTHRRRRCSRRPQSRHRRRLAHRTSGDAGNLPRPRRRVRKKPPVPEAIEVADRWHLWHDLAEALDKTVAAHHYCLKREPESAPEPSPSTAPASTCPTHRRTTSISGVRHRVAVSSPRSRRRGWSPSPNAEPTQSSTPRSARAALRSGNWEPI